MSHIHQDLPERNPMRSAWAGIVATDAASLSDMIWVILPDLDENIRIGPCRWQARDQVNLPQRDDDCLVIFDNDHQPWVVAWWPF